MASNKLNNSSYSHDPVVQHNGMLIRDFKDDLFDYSGASMAKLTHTSGRYLPQSSTNSIFQGQQQQLDYIINIPKDICHFKKLSLRMVINNNDAANVATVKPSQFLVNYVETLIGGSTYTTEYNFHNMLYDLYFTNNDEEIKNLQPLKQFTGGIDGVAYSNVLTIPASSQAIVFYDINSFLSKTDIFVSCISDTIGIRVQFAPSAVVSTSASTNISLVDADLMIEGINYNDEVKNKIFSRYRSMPHVFPYYEPMRVLVSGQAVSDTTKSQIKITEVGGYNASALFVCVVPNSANNENLYSFQGVQKLDLLREGKTVASFQDLPTDFIKRQMTNLFPTSAVRTNNIYCLPFSKDPVTSVNWGRQLGCEKLTNNDVLEVQMNAGGAGTYDIYVLVWRFDNISIDTAGRLSIQQVQ